jgi:hypothetical protein
MINWLEQHLSPCFFKSHFGNLECPGCGMQRSLIALLKGDILESLHYHVALIPFIITISLLIAQLIIKHEKGGKWVMWAFIITTGITVVQFIIKQIMLFQTH